MAEIQLGDKSFAAFDRVATPLDPVTFAGPCLAIGNIAAGPDMGAGGRLTTILTASIDATTVGQIGAIDYDAVGHNSPGPSAFTFFVPVGHHGKFVLSGGKPTAYVVTLVRI